MTFAIFSEYNNQVQVHYSHLTEEQAQNEVDRLNDLCHYYGRPAVHWCEEHHPDAVYVIG